MLNKKIYYKLVTLIFGFFLILGGLVNSIALSIDENKSFENIDEQLLDLMKKGHIPTLSACIIKNDAVVWTKHYENYKIPFSDNEETRDIYMVASISKTLTATAIMQLYDKGLFNLDDDINDYIPISIRNPKYENDPITFRMLLSHRSSITLNLLSSEDYNNNYFFKNFLYLAHLKDILSNFYPNVFSEFIQDVLIPNGSLYEANYWGDFSPGSQSSYSGINFIILGYVIELLTNQSFNSYCKENIFLPLHMNNSSFLMKDLNNERLAIPYLWFGAGIYLPVPNYEYYSYNPASGLRTTVEDLSHFLIAHMNNGLFHEVRILNESTAIMMHDIQYSGIGYGLGFEIGTIGFNRIIGHWGRNVGFIAHMFFSHSKDCGIIYMYNEYSPNSAVFNGDYLGFTPKEGDARYEIPNILWEKANEL